MKCFLPTRQACRRLQSRCLILADGKVVACDQDFRATHPLGDLLSGSLAQLWTAPNFAALRSAHRMLDLAAFPLCTACNDWHRP